MIMTMEDEFKRWTAKRKAALVTEIIQGKTSISEASCSFDFRSEIVGLPKTPNQTFEMFVLAA